MNQNNISNTDIKIDSTIESASNMSSISVGCIDTKCSTKYPITLEQARLRALKAIKRARAKQIII